MVFNLTTMAFSNMGSLDVFIMPQNSSSISFDEEPLSEYGKPYDALSNSPGWLRAFVSYNGIIMFLGIAIALCLWQRLSLHHDPKEPDLLKHNIPFVGHLMGLHKHGVKYFNMMSARVPLPIYTLNIFSSKIYVVTLPELITAVQRNTKSMSFTPLVAAVSERLLQVDKKDMVIVKDNMNRERGNFGYMRDLHNTHHKLLSPGASLNRMRDEALREISHFLNETDRDSSGVVVDLYAWNRHVFTQSSASAVWGQMNPFKVQPELEDAFWTVEEEMKSLLLNILPEYTAPSGSVAREKMYQAFLSYYRNHGSFDPSASDLVQAKTALNRKYGFSTEYMAHSDLGELTAVLFNVVPAGFWLLLYIYSSPSLLAEIRTEVQAIFVQRLAVDGPGESFGVLNITLIRQNCPLLCSTYKEVLRLIGSVTTNRLVLEDTTIKATDKEYLLKKGAIVEIPGAVLHEDASIWGPDARDFNPGRFLDNLTNQKRHPAAFRTFGGGATLCPGRHFAFVEILSFVSMIVMGFDMTPENGVWALPKKDTSRLPGVVKPVTDVKVRIRRREGFERTRWIYNTTGMEF